jgi:glycogen(starch) synthase
LALVGYGLRLVVAALRFHADYLVVAEGSTHWFALYLLPRTRCRIILSIHCVLWPEYGPNRTKGLLRQVWLSLSRRLFRRHAYAIMSASDDITKQIYEIAKGEPRPVIPFLPSYRSGTFSTEQSPPAPPFRVLFAGRIETEKGVFTLLEVARMLKDAGENQIEFEICGDGSALARLRSETTRAGLTHSFHCHGHCNRATMSELFKRCHMVVVPTTTAFGEGFNQVVVESVLAGRPVVTSVVCPSRNYVSEAVVEVPPDEPAGYAQAILNLYHNAAVSEQKRTACAQYADQFYDKANGWGAALQRAIQQKDPVVTE